MTTCIYLPDGRVAFTYHRPEISDNDAFDAGGMRFEVIEPFEALRASLPRQDLRARRAAADGRPAQGVHREPVDRLRGRARLPRHRRRCSAASPSTTTARRSRRPPSEGFARGHYEQHVGARGVIRVGDEEWAVDGFGLRDHSWGPRFWQSPWWYRWLTGNFGDDGGFVIVDHRPRATARSGSVASCSKTASTAPIEHATIDTDWRTDDSYHERIRADARGRRRASTRSKARCCRSSRCGTGARRPTASSS